MGEKRTRVSGVVRILLSLRSATSSPVLPRQPLLSVVFCVKIGASVSQGVASRLVNEGIRTEETVPICTRRDCVE